MTPPAYRPSKATQQTVGVEEQIEFMALVAKNYDGSGDCPMEKGMAPAILLSLQRLSAAEKDAQRYQILFAHSNAELDAQGISLQRFSVDAPYDKAWFDKALDSALSQQQDKTP